MASTTTRRAWLAGIGMLAAAGGAFWYRQRPPTAAEPDASDGERIDLWSERFERPGGGELVMAELRGKPLLINFWATWCPPCIKELPEIERFARDHGAHVRVVGLAIDRLEPVQDFLKKLPLSFDIGLAGMAGTDLARSLGNSAGALLFSDAARGGGAVGTAQAGETAKNWSPE